MDNISESNIIGVILIPLVALPMIVAVIVLLILILLSFAIIEKGNPIGGISLLLVSSAALYGTWLIGKYLVGLLE